MSTHHRLTPPFLVVPEQQDFPDAWEHFCCKLLNLARGTARIYVRQPPEQGIDLYDPETRTAYQCKSVESGKSGDFNAAHAVQSIESAQRVQADLGWENYALCTNVAVTGTAEATLKKALKDIEILPSSHWVQLCERFPLETERNFRQLLEVPRARVFDALHDVFRDHYASHLHQRLDESAFDVLLYSNRHDTVYRLQVCDDFKIQDLLALLRSFFRLPSSMDISAQGMHISLSYAIVSNGRKLPLAHTVKEAGINEGSVLTYWVTMRWKDVQGDFEGNVMQLATIPSFDPRSSVGERRRRAMSEYGSIIVKRFEEFEASLIHADR